MLKAINKDFNNVLLYVILLVAAILRFWNFTEIPFMHDELSALLRAQADSFSEIIQKMKETDVHPVGVSVFIHYWSALFGKQEFIIKLPFLVASITAIFFTYKIAVKWFNPTVGLFTAAYLATLQFPVMYGQLARPYATGLLFSVLMAWFWTNYFFDDEKKQNKNLIGFIISASLCTYNHYFSFLFAVVVGCTGLFFLNRSNYKKYLAACVAIVVFFLPHVPILLHHLSLGESDEQTWIAKPTSFWFFDYLKYLFHFSKLVYLLLAVLFVSGLIYFKRQLFVFNKMHVITVVWAFTSFVIVYLFSVYKSPVLQLSTMIFTLPFLLILFFSFYPDVSNSFKIIGLTLILSVNCYTLATERKHHTLFYNQPYEQWAKWSIKLIKEKGKTNLTIAHKVPEGFMDYYFEKYGETFQFLIITDEFNPKKFREFVSEQTSDYFLGGNLPEEYVQIVKEKYPYVETKEEGFTYTVACYSKNRPQTALKDLVVFSEQNTFKTTSDKWFQDIACVDSAENGDRFFKMDSTIEYGPTFAVKLKDIVRSKYTTINAKAIVYASDTTANPVLVVVINDGDKLLSWRGAEYAWFNNNPGEVNTVYNCGLLAGFDLEAHPDAEMKVYMWNKNKKSFYIHDISVEAIKCNPLIFGLYVPIEK